MREELKVRLKVAPESGRHCPAHEALVEVLLGLDRRLGRIEIFLGLLTVAGLSLAGKLAVWPLVTRILGL